MDLRPRQAGFGSSWSGPKMNTEDVTNAATVDSSAARQRPIERDLDATSSSHDYCQTTTHAGHGEAEPRPDTHPPAYQHRQFKRRYKPRTCRICLEVVLPTFDDADEALHEEEPAADGVDAVVGGIERIGVRVAGAMASAIPSFLRPQPRVRYVSEDPQDGRLVCPCHCKGTQKYVHEGCLTAWRHAQPLSGRHYWKCPTCGFEYRFERLRWGRWISNRVTRATLTFLAFWMAIFLLGFIADPLIDLWLDPANMIADTISDFGDPDTGDDILGNLAGILHPHHGDDSDWSATGWAEHFLKGVFSLGIVGVIKTFLAVSPFTWWNIRGRVRRRAGGGRARIEGFGWMFVLVGAFTFLGVAWKGINYLSGRVLERASEHVVDIHGDEADESDADDDNEGQPQDD
ncbi:ring finger domain containing protein [Grosmannia clavigera kw1407]|uniref:Ring finger domain containing protein n=1 Tax=Grosmannia clavigera (strain kw1407 / UAMH 11150) TaxID=655863 RepID=F0XTU9_GROCL|nr:ring finger domain containing protein [Grosmannia clavigera kw1407]EFW98525.1 ring finger domain containing protein [Grosmannia clavigera kw1407]